MTLAVFVSYVVFSLVFLLIMDIGYQVLVSESDV